MKRALLLSSSLLSSMLLWSSQAGAAGALESLAPEIVRGLGAIPAGAVVVASPLHSDLPAPKGDELSLRLAALIAGKLGGTARAHGQSAQLATARAVSSKGGALVYVAVEIVKGQLRATADLYPVMSNGWDRIRVPAPPPRAHAFAMAPLDAEVRAFLPTILLEQASVHKARHDEGEVLAAACGDADGDGGMEIVLVSRARVVMGHLRASRFAADKSADWASLAPRRPVPLREPLGAAVFQPGGSESRLHVGTTDRGGVSLDENLAPEAPLSGLPVPFQEGDACANVNAEESAFEGIAASCRRAVRDQVVRFHPAAGRFDAVAAGEAVAPSGKTRSIVVAREPTGKLRMRLGEDVRVLDGVGAQVAVGDLDQDGVPEIVTSSDVVEGTATRPSTEDAILITSWGGGEPRLRLRIPAPGGVRALAVCPPEERGLPAVVAVVGSEVWIVR